MLQRSFKHCSLVAKMHVLLPHNVLHLPGYCNCTKYVQLFVVQNMVIGRALPNAVPLLNVTLLVTALLMMFIKVRCQKVLQNYVTFSVMHCVYIEPIESTVHWLGHYAFAFPTMESKSLLPNKHLYMFSPG